MGTRKTGGRKGLFALSSTALAAALASPAMAQDEPVSTGTEIVVTAQQREQNIQDVPVAVTALNAQQLESAGVADIRALQTLSPSINLNSSQTESGGTTMRIRGVGTTGNNPGLESAVGVFIDGVYISRPAAALGELLDIQQVEILRGPQGTLFGRNTSAGALTITTRRPDLQDFGTFGNMTIGGGEFGALLSSQVGLNIPIIEDTLGIRIAAAGRVRDGLLESTFNNGTEQNTRDRFLVRAQALWEPTENISARFIYDYQEGHDNCCDAVVLIESPFVGLGAYGAAGLGAQGGVFASGDLAFENRMSNSQRFEDPGLQTGYTAQVDWDLGFGELTYIGSFRDSKVGPNIQESDFVGLDVFSVGGSTQTTGPNRNFAGTDYTSHEIRLAGEVGRLDWLVGYYWGQEEIETTGQLTLGSQFQANLNANLYAALAGAGLTTPAAIVAAFTPALGAAGAAAFAANPAGFYAQNPLGNSYTGANAVNTFTQDGDTQSFFTHNTLAVTDRLDLTVGLRFVEETKDGRFVQASASNPACAGVLSNPFTTATAATTGGLAVAFACFPFATPANFPGAGTPAGPPTPALFNNTFEDEELVYTANASYAFTDDVRAYVSFTHGFKSGGFNLDPTAASRGADPRFRSELVDAYEFGLKSELFDGALRANFALFRSEIEDFQVLEFTGVQFITFNVPEVLAEGAEMELFGQLSEDLSGSFSVTYSDAGYPSDCAPASAALQVRNLCGNSLTNAPEWTSILGLNWEREINDNLRFYASGSVRYESDRRTST